MGAVAARAEVASTAHGSSPNMSLLLSRRQTECWTRASECTTDGVFWPGKRSNEKQNSSVDRYRIRRGDMPGKVQAQHHGTGEVSWIGICAYHGELDCATHLEGVEGRFLSTRSGGGR